MTPRCLLGFSNAAWEAAEARESHVCAWDGACRHVGRVGARLPFAAVEDVCYGLDTGQIAMRAGVSLRQIQRWRLEGVPASSADRVACALGYHPFSLWGDLWDAVA